MKVRELIDALVALKNPELPVVVYTEDESIVASKHIFRLFDIEVVVASHATRMRDDDHRPTLKLGDGPAAELIAFLNVTSDF